MKKIGSVNMATIATLYKGKKVVGYCMDTPNAIAYGFSKTKATVAKSLIGVWLAKDMKNRVENAGWFTKDSHAMFSYA